MDKLEKQILDGISDLSTNIDEVERFIKSSLWQDILNILLVRERLLHVAFVNARETNEMFNIQGALSEIEGLKEAPELILEELKQKGKDNTNGKD